MICLWSYWANMTKEHLDSGKCLPMNSRCSSYICFWKLLRQFLSHGSLASEKWWTTAWSWVRVAHYLAFMFLSHLEKIDLFSEMNFNNYPLKVSYLIDSIFKFVMSNSCLSQELRSSHSESCSNLVSKASILFEL